jgi:polysaccharide deacetylase family protein (PEP-CTERM system associated)
MAGFTAREASERLFVEIRRNALVLRLGRSPYSRLIGLQNRLRKSATAGNASEWLRIARLMLSYSRASQGLRQASSASSQQPKPMGLTKTEPAARGPVAITIDVEDWFHAENLKAAVRGIGWDNCELRVERNTMRMLEILEAAQSHATFFVLGWVAERCPALVRSIAAAGHEVASHGHNHDLVSCLSTSEFRADVLRSKRHLEDLTGKPVLGYRAPCFSMTEWALEVLKDVGFTYDSSIYPTLAHDRYGRINDIEAGWPIFLLPGGLYEVCVSCIRLGARGIPWGGGGYFRLVPYAIWRYGLRAILRTGIPYVFYIHPWEIDPGQPRVGPMTPTGAFRHRINLHRCEERFTALAAEFKSIAISELITSTTPKEVGN